MDSTDKLERYRQIIEAALTAISQVPHAYGDLQDQTIFDRQTDNYLLLTHGWQKARRVHYCLVHLQILDGKIWIHHDGVEYGIATDLEHAGVPKSDIVLGFHPPAVRPYTEYAAA
jgi:hypothetical protein